MAQREQISHLRIRRDVKKITENTKHYQKKYLQNKLLWCILSTEGCNFRKRCIIRSSEIKNSSKAAGDIMNNLLSELLNYLMKPCYWVCGDWYVAIVLFTLVTKILQFPISLWCQKNALTMVALMPEMNLIKMRHFGDSDQIGEKSAELFKERHYHPDVTPKIWTG